MIYDYEIKRKNKEEVLYIYLDINQEFAKLNAKKKKKKLKKSIEEYIKKNKIVFSGTTVAVLVSGLVVGTLTLKEPNQEINSSTTMDTYAISTLLESKHAKEVEVTTEEKVEKETQVKEEIKEEAKKEEQTIVKKETNTKEKKSTTQSVSTTTSNTKKDTTSSKKDEEPKIEEETIQVKVYRANGTVLNLGLEEYVVGVVGAEMPASFHIEALKAQAVLARTYALRSLKNNTRLTDTSSTQNYKSNEELKKLWGSSYSTYYNKIKSAVEETKGVYLTYKGEIIDAVYHSTSNGRTEDAKNVWGNSVPYLVSVISPYDDINSSYIQDKTFSYEELSEKLGFAIDSDTTFEIQSKTEGDRVLELLVDNKVYNGVALRNLLGLRSATFEMEKGEKEVTFTTIGYGHGVGMSQYGANGMAKNGNSYTSILKHYYTGVTLSHT